MSFRNRVVLVTGAGSGIGRAIALRFGKAGAKVVVNDLDAKSARAVAREIGSKKAIAVAADVTDSKAIHRMFARVKREHGRLDVLVNNAGIALTKQKDIDEFNRTTEARMAEAMSGEGISTHWQITEKLSDADWDRMLRTHLHGTFYSSRAAIPLLRAGKNPSIINMSSVAGLSGLEAVPHYSAAKAGLLGFTRALAQELGSQKIRVNAICPGFIETPMTDFMSDTVKGGVMAQTPLGRLGDPDEIAAAAIFLASDDARFVTGQWISPNGGLIMQ